MTDYWKGSTAPPVTQDAKAIAAKVKDTKSQKKTGPKSKQSNASAAANMRK